MTKNITEVLKYQVSERLTRYHEIANTCLQKLKDEEGVPPLALLEASDCVGYLRQDMGDLTPEGSLELLVDKAIEASYNSGTTWGVCRYHDAANGDSADVIIDTNIESLDSTSEGVDGELELDTLRSYALQQLAKDEDFAQSCSAELNKPQVVPTLVQRVASDCIKHLSLAKAEVEGATSSEVLIGKVMEASFYAGAIFGLKSYYGALGEQDVELVLDPNLEVEGYAKRVKRERVVTNEGFCALLKTIREDRGMTVTALSETLRQRTGKKVSTTAIRRIEDTNSSLSLRTMLSVLDALGGEVIVRWRKKVSK